MNGLKQLLHLLAGKSKQSILPENLLSAVELDGFQGGKPAEAIAGTAYWWIEEEPVAPGAATLLNQAPHRP